MGVRSGWDNKRQCWWATDGALCYWRGPEGQIVRARIALITDARVYLEATASEGGRKAGQCWYENRYGTQVAPREAVRLKAGKPVSWPSHYPVRFVAASE